MNILMVLDHEYPADIRVGKEIQTLLKAGHKVDLACLTIEDRATIEEINNHTIYRKKISPILLKTSVGALKFPFYFNFWRAFLRTLIQSKNYDAIHVHDLPLAKVGHELSIKYNLKFVLDSHENWPILLDLSPHTKSLLGRFLSNNKQWLQYETMYTSLADALIVVAEEMKNRMIKNGTINNNIYVVPNTTELDIFKKMKDVKPDNNFITLFYSGGINKHRGIEVVIKGLSQMDLPNNFRFWIVGSGRNEPFVKKMVSDLNLEKHVVFWGWKSQTEAFKFLLESDIAVIPHLRNEHTDNTSPNKIFHYMLAAKPIISSDCKYLKNIINETNAGITYTNDSNLDFANKLTYMLKRREDWDNYGKNGFKAVVNKYNWEKTSKPLIRLYEE